MFKIANGVPSRITDKEFRVSIAPSVPPRGYQKNATFLASYGIVVPTLTAEPTYNTATQTVTPDSLPVLESGVWALGWTVADKSSADITQERLAEASAECQRRIFAIADSTAQMNMASAASADMLTDDQMLAWKAALMWVTQMRATWEPLAASNSDITSDANWPNCPAAAAALADGF